MSGEVSNLNASKWVDEELQDAREAEGLRQRSQQQRAAGTAPASPAQRLLQWQAEQAAQHRRQPGSSGQGGGATSGANKQTSPQ